ESFITKQFFLKSPSAEYAMLEEVNKIINKYDYIASYNGKGFDTHILESRFILNRISSRLAELNHIDLLYPCRAFFRRYLGSASLQDIERGILNYTRQDDIPGALIPYVYFDFLKSGNDEKIHAVIEHNRLDILSLAFIIKLLNTLMKNPSESPHELVSLSAANYLKNKRISGEAKIHFENIIQRGNNDTLRKEAKKSLSMLLKREDIDKASLLWEEEKDELYAIIELAKYHEHKTKRIDVALEITNEGLDKCRLMRELENNNLKHLYDELEKRKRRLLRKLKRNTKT
ncbi:ribonuclease H-like domain-containing protein, partial [candidate division WOR-3 bacterium]|nr:ribonuclease H-like domain-containing protein [candidate division WOR-3 bacterium]